MSAPKVGDSFPGGVVFSYVPYTPETSDITACGIPINYDASKGTLFPHNKILPSHTPRNHLLNRISPIATHSSPSSPSPPHYLITLTNATKQNGPTKRSSSSQSLALSPLAVAPSTSRAISPAGPSSKAKASISLLSLRSMMRGL
jgi:hypothetical protein